MKKTSKSEPDLGRRIAATRVQRGLSQQTISRRSGIDPSYLSRVETGKIQPTVRTAHRIAAALRMPLAELLRPSPASRKDRPCPVSPGGHCLMDLIDVGPDPGVQPERYSLRQLRLIRRFTALVQRGGPKLLTALEVLVGEILKDEAGNGRSAGGSRRGPTSGR